MPKIQDPTHMFITKVQALYDTEKQLEKALLKMAKAATDAELKEGFMMHLEETKNQSIRLERIFDMLELKPKKLASEGIRGILEDSAWIMDVDAPDYIVDSMLAASGRYAEHYEMAGYMTAIALAKELGLSEAATLLSETLVEEETADEMLASAMTKKLSEESKTL